MSFNHSTPPNSPASHIAMHRSRPAPRWFIRRSQDVVTPLVPADELPVDLSLRNLPRHMSISDTHGMVNVGQYAWSGFHYVQDQMETHTAQKADHHHHTSLIDRSSNDASAISYQPFYMISNIPNHEIGTTRRSTQVQQDVSSSAGKGITTSSSDNHERRPSTVNVSPPLPPSGKEPDQKRKVYCTHWIRHGECDYMQQGCLYKHEMPSDLRTLRAIGFQKYPQWWINKQMQNQARHKAAATRAEKVRDHLVRPLPPIGAERNAQRASMVPITTNDGVANQLAMLNLNDMQSGRKNVGGLAASKHAQRLPDTASRTHSSQTLHEADIDQPLIDLNSPAIEFSHNNTARPHLEHRPQRADQSSDASCELTPLQTHLRRFTRSFDIVPTSEEDETTDTNKLSPKLIPTKPKEMNKKKQKLLRSEKAPVSAKTSHKRHIVGSEYPPSGLDESLQPKVRSNRKGRERKEKITKVVAKSGSSCSGDSEDSGFETATGVGIV